VIFIGADHRGFELKAQINEWLSGRGFEFEDKGAYEADKSDDYVDFAIAVAQGVAKNPGKNRGIVICGSGVGVDVAANKVNGIRCGLGFAADQVHAARKDDNINVLALASDNTVYEEALQIVEQFLEAEFVDSESHRRRIEKIERIENLV